jgi:hypothetical protein
MPAQDGANRRLLYHQFCQEAKGLPLFFQPWWLDAVCGAGRWDVALSVDAIGQIHAAMPFYQRQRWGLPVLDMPPLTPFLGPWLVFPQGLDKPSSRYRFADRKTHALIAQLPRVWHQKINCHYHLEDWLPFFRQGYRQTTKYSYLLHGIKNQEKIWQDMTDKTRNVIRKAQGIVGVKRESDPRELHRLSAEVFTRQNLRPPHSLEQLERLTQAAQSRGQGCLLVARDARESAHAALFLVWDSASAYCLILSADTGLRNNGAASLLIWEALQIAATQVDVFDFEGSMLAGVESFFRSFGGRRVPYFQLTKSRYAWLEALKALRG